MDQRLPRISRIQALSFIVFGLMAIIIVRLFFVQVLQHDYYNQQAELEHTMKFTIPASRGLVYMHDGNEKVAPIVLNETVYTVYADPQYVKDTAKITDVVKRVAGGSAVKDFDSAIKNKDSRYAVLARQITKTQMDLIKKENLTGVGFKQETKRVYPEGQLAAQVLGFVNGEGKGQYGIEEALNSELAGTDGQLKAVTDVNGIPISVGDDSIQVAPQNGKNFVLTIDRNAQSAAEQILKSGLDRAKATKGSVLVMDPNNGHILAMANYPTYNPNDFGQVADYTVFSNRTISDPYEPGSVIKALTMGVGLNEKIITPATTYNNTGSVQVQDALIKNASLNPLGTLSMTQVLQYSFNTGVVQVLKWLGGGEINKAGKQKLYDYFTDHYLFGKRTGVQLAGETAGEIVSPKDSQGGDVRYANMSFGQGMSASMMQVLAAFAAAINGGTYFTPKIIDGTVATGGGSYEALPDNIKKSDVISADASLQLRQMLHDARAGSTVSAGEKSGYYIGGKTGTAQVYDPKTGDYSEADTIGSYLGFGGQEKPQYVIMVRVDDAHNGGFSGSAAAAPIFTELSNWMLNYLQIQPKG